MASKTLYRAFRPKKFSDVSGQDHVTDILENQIKKGTPGHAYLFCGSRGTGKTTSARILANALNCLSPVDGSPCGECEVCRAFEEDAFVDVLEIDAASNNGVDNIRDIREKAALLPVSGKYKVYIIDEVHMLSPGAFNALLKTLEEPPQHAVFILATTEFRKIPKTIVSRCQRFDFKRISDEDIVSRLEYVAGEIGASCEEGVFELVASQSDGALRDALSLFDQCLAGRTGLTKQDVRHALGIPDAELVEGLCTAIEQGDASSALRYSEEMQQDGTAAVHVLQDAVVELSKRLARSAGDHDVAADLLRSLDCLITAQTSLRFAPVPKAVLSAAIVRAALPATDKADENLSLRVRRLEDQVERLQSGQPLPAARPASPRTKDQKPASIPDQQSVSDGKVPSGAKPDSTHTEKKQDGEERTQLKDFVRILTEANAALGPAAATIHAAHRKGTELILDVAEDDIVLTEVLLAEEQAGDVRAALEQAYGKPAPRLRIETKNKPEEPDESDEIVSILTEFVGPGQPVEIVE